MHRNETPIEDDYDCPEPLTESEIQQIAQDIHDRHGFIIYRTRFCIGDECMYGEYKCAFGPKDIANIIGWKDQCPNDVEWEECKRVID